MFVNCMLLVIDPEAHFPVVYSSVITDDTKKEVEKACFAVGIDETSEEDVNDISICLDKGDVSWWGELFCFQIIPIK